MVLCNKPSGTLGCFSSVSLREKKSLHSCFVAVYSKATTSTETQHSFTWECVFVPDVRRGIPTHHGVLPGCVLALVAMVTGIASRLVVCLPLLQRHHLPGGCGSARCTQAHTGNMFNLQSINTLSAHIRRRLHQGGQLFTSLWSPFEAERGERFENCTTLMWHLPAWLSKKKNRNLRIHCMHRPGMS